MTNSEAEARHIFHMRQKMADMGEVGSLHELPGYRWISQSDSAIRYGELLWLLGVQMSKHLCYTHC